MPTMGSITSAPPTPTWVWRVQPGAVENAVARMESRLPAGEVLPCDEDGRPREPGVVAISERGETPLVVCTDAPYPPFEYEDPSGYSPSGYKTLSIVPTSCDTT